MRHGTCFRRRLSAHHAGAAPHSAVAELGVVRRLLASAMNHTFSRLFRIGALAKSEAFDSALLLSHELVSSRTTRAAFACQPFALSVRRSLRLRGCLFPLRTLLSTSLSAMRSPFHARSQEAVANPTQTPNQTLQPTGVRVTAHASRHLRPPPPSPTHGPRHARPWLSLGSLGVSTHQP